MSTAEPGWVLETSPRRIIPGLAAFHAGSQASLGEPEGFVGLLPSAQPGPGNQLHLNESLAPPGGTRMSGPLGSQSPEDAWDKNHLPRGVQQGRRGDVS